MKFEITLIELSLAQNPVEFEAAMKHINETKTDEYRMEDLAVIPTLPSFLSDKGKEIEKDLGVTFLHFFVSGYFGSRHGKDYIIISGIIEK